MSGAGGDGLQLQARTARGSGRGGGLCLHCCTPLLCPCIAEGAGVGYEQGTGATQSRGPDGKQSEGYAGGTDGNRRGSAIGDSPS